MSRSICLAIILVPCTYLKAGSSDYPLEVIKKAGVDMTNTDYLDAAFKVFEDRLVELEALVEKGVHLS